MGVLGLKRREFERMTMGDYNRICIHHMLKKIDNSMMLRTIIAAQVGKDPRQLWELPGDYKDIPLDDEEQRAKVLHAFNMYDAWGGGKKKAEC